VHNISGTRPLCCTLDVVLPPIFSPAMPCSSWSASGEQGTVPGVAVGGRVSAKMTESWWRAWIWGVPILLGGRGAHELG
jgi:hypothetical protein